MPHLLQALHFFVGFGALLSPLIADPFLSDTNCILSNATANASSNLPHIRKSLVPHHPGNLSHYDLPMKGMVVTRVSYAFWIMALINVSAAGAVGVPQTMLVVGGSPWVVPAMEEASGWLWSAGALSALLGSCLYLQHPRIQDLKQLAMLRATKSSHCQPGVGAGGVRKAQQEGDSQPLYL